MDNQENTSPITLAEPVRLIRQMNHDLRNSLNTLMLTLSLMDQGAYGPLQPPQIKAVKRMQRTAHRSLALIDDIADYVKAEANQYPLSNSSFALQPLVKEIMAEVKSVVDELGATLQLETELDGDTFLTNDQNVVHKILLALLWNAISFSGGGTVQIRLERVGDGAYKVFVKDDGQGLDPTAVTRFFELFWRGANDRKPVPTSGFGTGMAAARALAAKISATLTLAETGAPGSTFVLTIPNKPDPA